MDLTWLSAWRLRELIAEREVSPVSVTEHFLGRAEELDPILHCYRSLDDASARAQAKLAEQAVLAGEPLGPLHGVPVAVKEHIAVRGLSVFAIDLGASPSDEENEPIAPRDAPVVRRLRESGAVVFGTTVMPGMGVLGLRDANGDATDDLAWHSRNPWDLDRVPGSSSAGGCAAVSGGVLPIAIGTDGGGSTRLPAAWSGLVGLHPTMGRVPMGQPPGGSWNISQGPLTRDARDNALVLQAIAGPDGAEVISLQNDAPNYLADLERGVEGFRFAWTDDFGCAGAYAGPESSRVIDAVRSAAQGFTNLAAAVESIDCRFPDWNTMLNLGVTGYPAASGEAYRKAQDDRSTWWSGLRQIFTEHDLLLSPTIQHVAFTLERWNESWTTGLAVFSSQWCAHTFPHNFLGWPALAVPCGFVDGLPVSLQITGPPDSEPTIYRAAHALLEAAPFDRRPPTG